MQSQNGKYLEYQYLIANCKQNIYAKDTISPQ